MCGGTQFWAISVQVQEGLSPRVRGNRRRAAARWPGVRSIPACAGEPHSSPTIRTSRRVYPRVCGGTTLFADDPDIPPGLSPRVRGNHTLRRRSGHPAGSIPACAGEPILAKRLRPSDEVYPRVCGGTRDLADGDQGQVGLSPRVRGNRLRIGGEDADLGSIPACAGEPWTGWPRTPRTKVYPRVCGGTRAGQPHTAMGEGLSPRVRGNPGCAPPPPSQPGSIPACAGEPPSPCARRPHRPVYPRVCGGTPSGTEVKWYIWASFYGDQH